MPHPLPPPARSGPRRRSVLASAAGAALLAGCSTGPDSGDDGPSAASRARARAARDSRGLLQRYDAVLAAHPGLADRLRPLRTQVAAHAEAFEEGAPASGPGTATASVTASASAAPVPATEKDAVAGLAAAERALSDQRARDLLEAPGELARLLASVAAAGAAHAYLLTEGNR
ncbi:hypothetical protein JK361_26395 [Streptomyces sp. 5-8]|uniref:Lipoprotein n=1 Tax=Streptomyces musisoli TaxID=2802280 RepID=A0ABS1P6T3_9ACTN|nr:hypothetical protein [Streptomyces musisoli]MBL1108078.1 hypothetical protein [Streptomyces musisoli]